MPVAISTDRATSGAATKTAPCEMSKPPPIIVMVAADAAIRTSACWSRMLVRLASVRKLAVARQQHEEPEDDPDDGVVSAIRRRS